MRKKTVAGNWKMNMNYSEAKSLYSEVLSFEFPSNTEVIIAPPFIYLSEFAQIKSTNLKLAAQNCASQKNGAYTGEVSAEMLASLKVDYCLVGHSERRSYFNENESDFKSKIQRLLENDIVPIYCIGETLAEREGDMAFEVVKAQIENALFEFPDLDNVVLAYEPVWAIGTGKTATAEQAQEMHAFIRGLIASKYGEKTAKNTVVLYGGSVNSSNAKELFAQHDIDGGLIGGASLKSESFKELINA